MTLSFRTRLAIVLAALALLLAPALAAHKHTPSTSYANGYDTSPG